MMVLNDRETFECLARDGDPTDVRGGQSACGDNLTFPDTSSTWCTLPRICL